MSDLINRQDVLDRFQKICKMCGEDKKYNGIMCRSCYFEDAIDIVDEMEPAEQPEIIRCQHCKYWDRIEDSPIGYCHAIKHGYHSENWEIIIRRTYRGDFFCADGELRTKDDEYDAE